MPWSWGTLRMQGQSPWLGARGEAPLKLKAFLFWDIPREGPFFT